MLTVARWNLANLFRPGVDGGPTHEAAYKAKRSALAATIARIAPELLAVHPVGGADTLADFGGASTDRDWDHHLRRSLRPIDRPCRRLPHVS